MKELIKIHESTKTGSPVVNARDLYDFLEVGEDFSNWLKRKIKKYGFIENIDFARIYFDINGKKMSYAKNSESDNQWFEKVYRIEYALTLDCAKELAMVQNNERGKEARLYFIDVEKKYREIKEGKSKILYDLSEVAQKLDLKDYYGKIGRNDLCDILRHKKIFDKKNHPVQKYIKKGYFVGYQTTIVTEEGFRWLNQALSLEKTMGFDELKTQLDEMKQNQALMLEGVTTVVETLYFNKGGHRTEDQNRQSIIDLRKFLETVKKLPKALE
jgi:phage anti-repressor protein